MPSRDISISGMGVLIIGTKRFDGIQYHIAGTKRSRLVDGETVLSAELRGQILNPQNVDLASQSKTMDIECRLIRSDGRVIAIDFSGFPNFQVMRAADDDSWSDAVLGI